MPRCFIGLGSNLAGGLASPAAQLQAALAALNELSFSDVVKVSSFYQSKAWNPDPDAAPSPDYLNAVCLLKTDLAADALLDELQRIEVEQGRPQGDARYKQGRYAPRTLDLDLLTYGQSQLRSARLIVPHERMHERAFVLQPLLEIAPEFEIPGRGLAASLLVQAHEADDRGKLIRLIT
jgi:2-amino-4-hydroxy-6-hydroxymethyldihydropteridine diphosphokinase